MKQIKTLVKLVKEGNNKKIGKAIALNISLSKISRFIPDKIYLKILYRCYFGKRLNLSMPKTFNEKLQWLKLYDRKSIYTDMLDKNRAKEYSANIIGQEHIIQTYGLWNEFDDIDFEKMPDKFVLKCTHDSGSIVICKDAAAFDVNIARKKIEKGMGVNSYYYGREWPYKNVVPQILAEELLIDKKNSDLRDYKFFCFNGKVKCFKIDFERFVSHRANYYDRECNLLHFGEDDCPPNYKIELDIPNNISEMIELAEKLSNGTKFLRVDFYDVDGKIYFGEMTFFPASGFGTFTDAEWDKKLGEWIKL